MDTHLVLVLPGGGGSSTSTLYLNWHSGNGGVVIGNGSGAKAAKFDTLGNLEITTVNGRRPAWMVKNVCGSASCTASCSPGVVKTGWGFHGFDGSTTNGSSWACGSAVAWMGSCIGQTSCSVATSCSVSSIMLECW